MTTATCFKPYKKHSSLRTGAHGDLSFPALTMHSLESGEDSCRGLGLESDRVVWLQRARADCIGGRFVRRCKPAHISRRCSRGTNKLSQSLCCVLAREWFEGFSRVEITVRGSWLTTYMYIPRMLHKAPPYATAALSNSFGLESSKNVTRGKNIQQTGFPDGHPL